MSHDSRWSPREEDTLRKRVKRDGLKDAVPKVARELHRTEEAVRSKEWRMRKQKKR